MSSEKKIKANRLNSKKSTGPKTISGKRRSSLNSITHGLTCEKNVSIGENKKEFEELKKNAQHEITLNFLGCPTLTFNADVRSILQNKHHH